MNLFRPGIILSIGAFACVAMVAHGQRPPGSSWRTSPRPTVSPGSRKIPARSAPSPPARLKKARELIQKQEPMKFDTRLLEAVTPEDTQVIVSLGKQRAYLMKGDENVIDSPISSGKRGHSTPTGDFRISEKDKDHRSSLYGDFRDRRGRIVRAGVSRRIDAAPSGTHFVGAPMTWFMRITGDGVGMHVGILPGYPASHGCIRMPPQAAELFYKKVKVGTSVTVSQ